MIIFTNILLNNTPLVYKYKTYFMVFDMAIMKILIRIQNKRAMHIVVIIFSYTSNVYIDY